MSFSIQLGRFLYKRPLAGNVARAPSPANLSRASLDGQPRAAVATCYLCSFPNALISTSTPAGRSSFI
ncbi:MAG: hypothetical protein WA252_08825, partial [Candidatus Sulfotelmatobacter sp.]